MPDDQRAAVAATSPAPTRGPRSKITGRIVDGDGAPLGSVRVSLHSVGERWAKDVEAPDIDGDGYGGFEGASSSDGRFAFDVPTPTSSWTMIAIEPDPYHDIAQRHFGQAGGRHEPPLVAGDNDLGEFKLAATGAISGVVRDDAGQPIEKAQVSLDDAFPGDMGRAGESDASGAYTIAHVPPGKYVTEAVHKRHVSAKSEAIEIVARQTVMGIDFALAASLTISGLVVDDDGKPLAGARVQGWPRRSGRGAAAKSDAQGRFTVFLPQNDPYIFQASLADYSDVQESHGGAGHSPGANDVVLVMHKAVMTTFVVLDGESGQPIERYELEVVPREDQPYDGAVSIRTGNRGGTEHPAGEMRCEADPSKARVRITAQGFAPAEIDVTHESPTSPRCVVRLSRGDTLRGRVMLASQPVAKAKLLLRAGSLVRYYEEEEYTTPYDENDFYWNEGQPDDLVFTLPNAVEHEADADGRFAIGGLAAGEYRLEILGPKGSRAVLDPLVIKDVGDVVLAAGATLQGKVIVPAGIDPSAIKLQCWTFARSVPANVSADGSFRFEDLAAGEAHVTVAEAKGLVKWGEVPAVRLASGETRSITIDLGDRASCKPTLHVLVNGKPAEGVRVQLFTADRKYGDSMGQTDAHGVATGEVRAMGPVSARLMSYSLMPLGTFEKVFDLTAGSTPEATIDIKCGALEVEWPALPAGEPLYLVQIGANMDSDEKRMFAHAMPDFDSSNCDARLTGEHRARFAFMPVGEQDWTIDVQTVRNNVASSNYTYRRKLTIRAGETTECVLTEADRAK
jgi:hypothetical protein